VVGAEANAFGSCKDAPYCILTFFNGYDFVSLNL
jgi:hypothetical protein